MNDFLDVVEHNPITFIKTISEKLAEGYVVQNTIAGYPSFGAYCNSVRLFKGDTRSEVVIPDGFTGIVGHYEPLPFLLLLESAVQAGYRFKEDGDHFIDERSFKSVQMTLEEQKQKTPAKKVVKKALQAEPTIDELKGDE